MDHRVARLKTVEDCKHFADNALQRGEPQLAEQARERAIQIRAASHGAQTQVEYECLQAVYAYEEVLSQKNGKRQPAARTWQMIKKHGIIAAVEGVVMRPQDTQGFSALKNMGLIAYAFESVVLKHPASFRDEAVEMARKRMN